MTASELEVALAKVDINRHEAIDMLGSLGKPVCFIYYIIHILIVSAESRTCVFLC